MEGFLILLIIIILIHVLRVKKLKSELKDKDDKIKNLIDSGFLKPTLNVERFNKWFNSPKDSSVYAHSGIYLRVDKLSQHHIEEYIKSEIMGLVEYELFDLSDLIKFEDDIRKNWIKKINKQ